MEKKDLRALIRAKKRAMTPAQVEAASARLAQQLFRHPAYQAARSLYGYLSYNQEVRTAAILRRAQQDGKRVAVWEPTMPSGGMLITNPIPHQYAMPKDVIDAAINQALAEAKEQGVKGKATTPFLLARVCELTGGESLKSNIKLVLNNVALGAQIAAAMH